MNAKSPLELLSSYQRALVILQRIVPADQREEWLETWKAELWHARQDNRFDGSGRALLTGLVRDALWLRVDFWRQQWNGTATLCLLTLLLFCCFAAMLASLSDTSQIPLSRISFQLRLFFFEAPLVAFVGYAATPDKHIEHRSSTSVPWLRRRLFLATKALLTLFLALFLSSATLQVVSSSFPRTAFVLQTLLFLILSLIGIRWCLRDHEQRCKCCLRTLQSPSRVGRPSHNLLDSPGTELTCRNGHGSLNVPEMVTSWRQYSQWIVG